MNRDSVPSPYAAHVHPYPTRFHGGQWTRPVFGTPYVHSVQNNLRPVTFVDAQGNRETYLAGYGADSPAVVDTDGVPVIADAPDEHGNEAKPIRGARLGRRGKIDPAAPWGGNNGVFRTHGEGGGIFNRALAGVDGGGTLIAFMLGAAAGYGIHWYLNRGK
jgi:hypothetical protein